MRYINRLVLRTKEQTYLSNKQKQLTLDPSMLNAAWKSARQTAAMHAVFEILKKMAGNRERCMYCLDSQGADIEHFKPKACFPDVMFNWSNLLLCCSNCGRWKGSSFPLDPLHSTPLLIDPTAINPWDHLDFDPVTGNLTARFDISLSQFSLIGETTIKLLHLQRESLSQGHLRNYKRLCNAVNMALTNRDALVNITNTLLSDDEYGLLHWCFKSLGQTVEPFKTLKENYPNEWSQCVDSVV